MCCLKCKIDRGEERETLYIEDPTASSKFRGPFRRRCWVRRECESSLNLAYRMDLKRKGSYRTYPLAGWKAELLAKVGRKVYVQHVLIGMVIYLAMVVNHPAWALKAIDKMHRGFLWRG
jgi:hypothetical protein